MKCRKSQGHDTESRDPAYCSIVSFVVVFTSKGAAQSSVCLSGRHPVYLSSFLVFKVFTIQGYGYKICESKCYIHPENNVLSK